MNSNIEAIFRYFRERRQDGSIDRRGYLRDGSHFQKMFETRSVFACCVANPERNVFRKNIDASIAQR